MALLLSITPKIQQENPKAGMSQSAMVIFTSNYRLFCIQHT